MSMCKYISLIMIVMVSCGCVNFSKEYPTVKKFMLDVRRDVLPETVVNPIDIKVDRFDIANLYEGRSFVYRVADLQYENDFYNQFVLPPATIIAEAVKQWFVDSAFVGAVYDRRIYSDYSATITGRINDLHVDLRDRNRPVVILEIDFLVIDDRSYPAKVMLKRSYREERVAEKSSAEDFVQTYTHALSMMLEDFEKDIAAHLIRNS